MDVEHLLTTKDQLALIQAISQKTKAFSLNHWNQFVDCCSDCSENLLKIYSLSIEQINSSQLHLRICSILLDFFLKGELEYEKVLDCIEQAVSLNGSEYWNGAKIWSLCLQLAQAKKDSELERQLYKRMFKYPLNEIDNYWTEYCSKFEKEEEVERLYQQSLSWSNQRRKLENEYGGSFSIGNAFHLVNGMSKFMLPVWIKCYLENLLSSHQTEEQLWLFYLNYLWTNFKEKKLVLAKVDQSLLASPSSIALFKISFEFARYFGIPLDQSIERFYRVSNDLLEKCIGSNSGGEEERQKCILLFIYFFRFLIKGCREDCEMINSFYYKSIERIGKLLGFSYSLPIDLVWIEWMRREQKDTTREWENILKRHSNSPLAVSWYLADQKEQYKWSNPSKMTSLFKRTLGNSGKEQLARLYQEWELFEEEYGASENILESKFKHFIYDINSTLLNETTNLVQSNIVVKKRSESHSTERGTVEEKEMAIESEPKESKIKKKRGSESQSDTTIFMSNLSFSITKEDLISFFQLHNLNPVEVRIPKDRQGKPSKGIAYIDFESNEEITKALLLDRSKVKGRPAYLSPYNTPTERHEKKKLAGEQSNTLFVSRIPETLSKADLQELFPGAKDIRLLLTRTGTSKQIAYVEYQTEQECKEFYDSLPGENDFKKIVMEGGLFIKVEISNPQKAKEQKQLKQITRLIPRQIEKKAMTNEDFRKLL